MLYPIFWFIDQLIWFFIIVVFVRVVLSWLIAFDVVNIRNPFVASLNELATRLTEPAMRPIRALLGRLLGPALGGVDLSPLIVILLAYVAQMYVWVIYRAVG